jgi:hypothetical protein
MECRLSPDSGVGAVCHPEPAVLSGGRRISAVVFTLSLGDKLRRCFAEFTLSELRRFFSRKAGSE